MTKRERTAYIGLGSNLGDRSQILHSALDALSEREGIQIVAVTAESPVVGVVDLDRGSVQSLAAAELLVQVGVHDVETDADGQPVVDLVRDRRSEGGDDEVVLRDERAPDPLRVVVHAGRGERVEARSPCRR